MINEKSVVVFKNVSKNYQIGEVQIPALKEVSLEIKSGRFSMALGPSGCGKTTLLNLVGCIDKPSMGTVEVCHQTISELNDDQVTDFRSKNIGFIFQNFNLIPVLSAYENVEYPLVLLGVGEAERRDRTTQLLKSVGLEPYAGHRPNQLSGGQKQRVAIARALIKKPSLVLADEPTANLDSKTGASIIELMYQVQEEFGATFVFSTHDPQLISHAQDVFVFKDGSLIERSENGKTKKVEAL